MTVPNDPIMLLSFINTQLRDNYPSLDELCSTLGIDKNDLISKLYSIDYSYNKTLNQFK